MAPREVDRARAILMAGGFRRVSGTGEARALALEEGWDQRAAGKASHVVDLHWSAVNSLRLSCLFDFDACWEQRRELKRLGPSALGAVLLHLGSVTYFGLDPLGARIWRGLEANSPPADLCSAIAGDYGEAIERVRTDVRALLIQLSEHDPIGRA